MTESRPSHPRIESHCNYCPRWVGRFARSLLNWSSGQYLVSCGWVSLEELRYFYKGPQCAGYCPESDCGRSQEVSDHSSFQISMSRKENPYDNAYAESFIKTLKTEEVQPWEYRTMEDVQKRIPYFIENV